MNNVNIVHGSPIIGLAWTIQNITSQMSGVDRINNYNITYIRMFYSNLHLHAPLYQNQKRNTSFSISILVSIVYVFDNTHTRARTHTLSLSLSLSPVFITFTSRPVKGVIVDYTSVVNIFKIKTRKEVLER